MSDSHGEDLQEVHEPSLQVSLKVLKKELQGFDVLGNALVAPIREYRRKVNETCFGFTIEPNEEAGVKVREQVTECYDEYVHIPSSHSNHLSKVTAGDPVFVNPNSFDSLKEGQLDFAHWPEG